MWVYQRFQERGERRGRFGEEVYRKSCEDVYILSALWMISDTTIRPEIPTFMVSIHDVLVRVPKCKFIRYGGLLPVPVVDSVRLLGNKTFEKLLL